MWVYNFDIATLFQAALCNVAHTYSSCYRATSFSRFSMGVDGDEAKLCNLRCVFVNVCVCVPEDNLQLQYSVQGEHFRPK